MSKENEKSLKKWNIMKEQLIALCALEKISKGNEDFTKFLADDIQLKNLNSQLFTSLCYYILGIICFEEREKLIKWPLINIQTHTKFRKAMSSMVAVFQEKYPWAGIKKLPESYFMNPHCYPSRVVDFLLRLTNLAIHLSLQDPELLLMNTGDGLKPKEIIVMNEIVSNARQKEEEFMRHNVLSLTDFEEAKNTICNKCITLMQVNDELQSELNNLKAHAASEGIIPKDKKVELSDLKAKKEKNVAEIEEINKELSKYYNTSQEIFQKLKALKNPMSLCADDFGCDSASQDLVEPTSKTCENLYKLFQYLTSKNSTEEEESDFYNQLNIAKKCLTQEKEALSCFIAKMSTLKM